MSVASAGLTYMIAEPFDKSLQLIRRALADSELSIVGEIDSAGALNREAGKKGVRSRILLVDCPLLLFQALALDRAAAVLFPLHILVSAAGERTQVSLVNPAALFNARLPVGAAEPMEKLEARIALAMESVLLRSSRSRQ